jgi:hypothetical protein
VNVGTPLYKIDVSGSVAADQQTTPPVAPVAPPSPPPLAQPSNPHRHEAVQHGTKTHAKGNPSLIHFLGKRVSKSSNTTTALPAIKKSGSTPQNGTSKVGIWTSQQMVGYDAAWLGRPTLSNAEIEAIESGGASLIGYS